MTLVISIMRYKQLKRTCMLWGATKDTSYLPTVCIHSIQIITIRYQVLHSLNWRWNGKHRSKSFTWPLTSLILGHEFSYPKKCHNCWPRNFILMVSSTRFTIELHRLGWRSYWNQLLNIHTVEYSVARLKPPSHAISYSLFGYEQSREHGCVWRN